MYIMDVRSVIIPQKKVRKVLALHSEKRINRCALTVPTTLAEHNQTESKVERLRELQFKWPVIIFDIMTTHAHKTPSHKGRGPRRFLIVSTSVEQSRSTLLGSHEFTHLVVQPMSVTY